MHDGEPHVALKPIVEGMGLDWEAQRQRVSRDAVLSGCACVTQVRVGGQGRDVTILPLKFLNGFLFGIDENRVKPELREGVIAYKRECYDALSRYWLHGAAVRAEVEEEKTEIFSHDLSRGALAAIGGIVRAVNGKQVADLRDELVNMIVGPAFEFGDQIPHPAILDKTPGELFHEMFGAKSGSKMSPVLQEKIADYLSPGGLSYLKGIDDHGFHNGARPGGSSPQIVIPPPPPPNVKVDTKVVLDGRQIAAAVESRISHENRVPNSASGFDGRESWQHPEVAFG